MNNSVKSLALAAAFAGMLGGTSVRLNAQTAQSNGTSVQSTHAGVLLVQDKTLPKHACKGQNDCKGQGGGERSMPARTIARARVAAPPTVRTAEGRLTCPVVWGLGFESSLQLCLSSSNRRSAMPANRFNGFTDYGVGIGLRVPHYDHIFSKKPVVDWFEIISENYMVDGGRALQVLDEILAQYRVVQHGVSMYFGSAQPLNREHLKRLKELTRRTKTPWLSDHLCWGSVDGRYTHDLLPIPYTFEAVKMTAARIREVQDFLEIPIAVENVSSYAEFHESQMTEWEFLNEVVEAADCGILLDVNTSTSHPKSYFQPLRLRQQCSCRARGANSHRRPLQVW